MGSDCGGEYDVYLCLWVAGSYKEKGYGKELLQYAIQDAKEKGKNGICTIVAKKKKPYTADKKFLEKYGFQVMDSVGDFELMALCFQNKTPKFQETARKMEIPEKDVTIYYSVECPFTINCVREIEEFAKENKVKINFRKVDSLEKAKNMPCVFNNWATFVDGKYESNSLLNANMLAKLLKIER